MKKFLLLTFVLIASCGGNSGSRSGSPTFTGALDCSHHVTSPKGVQICSGQNIGANVPGIVDQQLDDLFRIAQNGQTTASGVNNYKPCADGGYQEGRTCFSTHASYMVYLVPRSPQCVNPGFTENADGSGYDETYTDDPKNHWDKDPRPGKVLLCAAGFMATGHGQMKGISAPGMAVVDAVDQMPIIRYEGEHNLLAQVDPNRYAATQYHYGNNGGHPILGDDVSSQK